MSVSETMVLDRADGASVVETVYERVKAMAISFEFRPGGRVNEVAVAKKIGVSRTPLREALNRLTADGFLTFSPKQGFFRKPLSVKEITDLYELREQVERGAVRMAVARATDAGLDEIEAFVADAAASPDGSTSAVLARDERFQLMVAALSGNRELMQSLANLNGRIRFVRWVNMEGRRDQIQAQHRAILDALRRRDGPRAEALITASITLRQDQIVQAVKDAFTRIYMSGEDALEPEAFTNQFY